MEPPGMEPAVLSISRAFTPLPVPGLLYNEQKDPFCNLSAPSGKSDHVYTFDHT
jgi:hypothetical protein